MTVLIASNLAIGDPADLVHGDCHEGRTIVKIGE